MTSPTFPDYAAQEEIIRVVGKAELLYKRGEKILRYGKTKWGTVHYKSTADKIKPYVTGRVLLAGLGMGNTALAVLEKGEVTELISYEIHQDIVDIFEAENEYDGRHTIIADDAYENKPDGTFDAVLFELMVYTQEDYDKAKSYVQWAITKLNTDGVVIIPYDKYLNHLIGELGSCDITYISGFQGRRPKELFIVCRKV